MPGIETPEAIFIPQSGGPDVVVEAPDVPTFEAIRDAVAGDKAPEPQFAALAVRLYRQYRKPLKSLTHYAREVDAGARLIEIASGQPVVGLTHYDVQAGLTTPDTHLLVGTSGGRGSEHTAEVACSASMQASIFHGAENPAGIFSRYETDTLSMPAPGLVLTTTERVAKDKIGHGIREGGILAVGEKGVKGLLTALARKELSDVRNDQREFGDSTALLLLAFFKEHEHEFPSLGSADFIREAGQQAVSALIAGTARVNRFQDKPGDGISRIARRLQGIDFTPDDQAPIVEGVLANMDRQGEARQGLTELAHAHGGTVEDFVQAQADGFMKHILGVDVG